MKWFRNLDTVVRRVIVLAVIGLLLVVIGLTVGWCKSRGEVERAKDQTTLSDARSNAGRDAIQTQDDVGQEKAAITDKVETGVDAIHNARSPADRNDAALRSLCNVDPSASPDCRLLQPRP